MKLEWYAEQHMGHAIRVTCEVLFPNGRRGAVGHFVSAQEWQHAGPTQRNYLTTHAVRVMTAGINRLEVRNNENVA